MLYGVWSGTIAEDDVEGEMREYVTPHRIEILETSYAHFDVLKRSAYLCFYHNIDAASDTVMWLQHKTSDLLGEEYNYETN